MSPQANIKLVVGLVVVVLVVALANASIYIVNETQRAVKLQFGKVVESDLQPGIHVKIPVIEEVKIFDGRLQVLDADPGEFLTSEKKRMIVDSFIMWRIKDAERFYIRTQGRTSMAQLLMSPRVNGGLKDKIASRTLAQIISDEREEIMNELQQEINVIFDDELGIEVVDIRVKSVEFSSEVSETVYAQMRTERNRDAAEYRSKGKEVAEGIRADADKQERIILAESYRDAEKIRGEGDAKAANLYAKAYGKDPKFYDLYRSLNAYKVSFQNKADIMILDPDSEFFNYLNSSKGK